MSDFMRMRLVPKSPELLIFYHHYVGTVTLSPGWSGKTQYDASPCTVIHYHRETSFQIDLSLHRGINVMQQLTADYSLALQHVDHQQNATYSEDDARYGTQGERPRQIILNLRSVDDDTKYYTSSWNKIIRHWRFFKSKTDTWQSSNNL